MKLTDLRIHYSISRRAYHCTLTGSKYEFDPQDSASRDAALTALEQNARTYIAAAEKKAGRPLNSKEIYEGVEKTKAPLAADIAAQSAAYAPNARKPFDGNPFRVAADEWQKYKNPNLTPKKHLEQQAAEWEEQHAAKLQAEETAKQPARIKAIAALDARLLDLKYQVAPEVEIRQLQSWRAALERGEDVSEFRQQFTPYLEQVKADKLAKAAERQTQLDALQAELNLLKTMDEEPEPLPAPVHVPKLAPEPAMISADEYRIARTKCEQSSDFRGKREFT